MTGYFIFRIFRDGKYSCRWHIKICGSKSCLDSNINQNTINSFARFTFTHTIKKLWTDFRASLYTYFSVGATDRHLLELEDVGEIKCIQFRISGSDGWNIAKVFQVLNI